MRSGDIFCLFFPQNGQTAQAVADGASHQDIVDLLKAHAESRISEPSSSTDLLWARPTLFTSTPLRLADPRPFNSQDPVARHHRGEKNQGCGANQQDCMTSGKKWICSVYRGTTMKPLRLECPVRYSSTSLPTCPVGVYGYAASTTQWTENKGSRQIIDKTLP